MVYQVGSFLIGMGSGYRFVNMRNKEDEILQGKNYYLAAVPFFPQTMETVNVFKRVMETIYQAPISFPSQLLLSSIPFLSFPFNMICCGVRQGHYSSFVNGFQQISEGTRLHRLALLFPKNLSERTTRVLTFLAKHSSNLLLAAMTVQGLSLVYFGQGALGAGILSMIAYRELSVRGYIPVSIKLLEQVYMPKLSAVAALVDKKSMIIAQLQSFTYLLTIVPSINRLFGYTINDFIRFTALKLFSLPPFSRSLVTNEMGGSLKEYEAPLIEQRNMTYEQMLEILDGTDQEYELNLAHCSKYINELPECKQFDRFLEMFNEIDWEQKYRLILLKAKDDDRFVDFLLEKTERDQRSIKIKNHIDEIRYFRNRRGQRIPKEEQNRYLQQESHFNAVIDHLAQEEKITKEQYLYNWIRSQMELLVQVLKMEKPAKGEAEDLYAGISNASKILRYLLDSRDSIEREDILLKLAIEAGFYCARGVKRATEDIVEEQLRSKGDKETDPQKIYERKILHRFQMLRNRLVQETFKIMKELLEVPKAVSEDVHFFDTYRKALTIGFHPINELERRYTGPVEVATWSVMIRGRTERKYLSMLYPEMEGLKDDYAFTHYTLEVIDASSLSADQKEDLKERLSSCDAQKVFYKAIDESSLGDWLKEDLKKQVHFYSTIQDCYQVITNYNDLLEYQKKALKEKIHSRDMMHKFRRLMLVRIGVLRKSERSFEERSEFLPISDEEFFERRFSSRLGRR